MSKVVVIGSGAMGLAAAHRVSKNGHEVVVLEASADMGGMAAHFDFGGISLERFYHFVCKTDQPTFDLMDELNIGALLRWVPTSMGFFIKGKLYKWGTPIALLTLPTLSFFEKIRYGIFAFVCVRRNSWPSLEHESADEWLTRWLGKSIFDNLWKPLLHYKFYEYADNVSAAWIWTRIRRIGRSRKSMMQEELGYIEGGTITLVNALGDAIEKQGGKIHLNEKATQVTTEDGRVTGVQTTTGFFAADYVISTAPTPLVSAMVPDLPNQWSERYESIHNIGVICVIFKLSRSVTPHFWVNITEEDVHIPGVIEFSNLRPMDGKTVIYVPHYMPVTEPKFSWSDEQLVDESFACLQRLNTLLQREDILSTKVARLRHAQPICEPNFAMKIPPVQTPIEGLQIADTCFYYPEDRGIAESIRLGQAMANALPHPA